MQTVKVTARIVQDDTGISIQIPVLVDENNEIVKPFLEFILKLKRDGKSQSTINNHTRAAQRLLEYMVVNTNGFSTPQSMFENFSSCLYSGTINEEGLDPSGLYWLPHSKQVTRIYIQALSQLTDWLAEKYNSVSINPWIKADSHTRRLSYAAWFRKNQHDFLGHIRDQYINSTAHYARSLQGKRSLGTQYQDAIEFPEIYFKEFYLNGLGGASDCRIAIRDQLILLLMHGGGLRESEALQVWIEDVLIDPFNDQSVKVRIYHPEDGKAPNNWRGRSGKTTRAAYLLEKYALIPRNNLIGKKNIGWKNRVSDSKDSYLEVQWFPAIYGEVFAKLWKSYVRFLTVVERNHPYAFVNFQHRQIGKPYTLNAFHYNYCQGLKRIGLKPSKSDGLSPHSHRHSYGRRLSRADINPIIIRKCLHHSSVDSQLVYTTPTIKEVSKVLNAAEKKLLNLSEANEQEFVPSWENLMVYGFKSIDPFELFSGKHPKLGRKK